MFSDGGFEANRIAQPRTAVGRPVNVLSDSVRVLAYGSLTRVCVAPLPRKDLLTDEDVIELKKLVSVRNPLTHFRNVDDAHNLDRRSIATGRHAGEILSKDAWFAITLAAGMLVKEPFRLG